MKAETDKNNIEEYEQYCDDVMTVRGLCDMLIPMEYKARDP